MVAATALIGAGIAILLLIELTPLDQYPVTMTISTTMAFSAIAVPAASAVLFVFVGRAIVAVRAPVITIALLLASFGGSSVAPLLGIAPTMEFAVAIMALTFSAWGWPSEEMVAALVMASRFGTAASFCFLQRAIAAAWYLPRELEHA